MRIFSNISRRNTILKVEQTPPIEEIPAEEVVPPVQETTPVEGEEPIVEELTPDKYAEHARGSRQGTRVNEDGTVSTHLMAWGELDEGFVAYPTLFQNDQGEFYTPEDPFKEAIEKKEIYKFGTSEEAEQFAAGSWKEKDE